MKQAVFAILASILCLAFAAPSSVKVTGFFSDMTLNAETGDVLGIEIHVVPTAKGFMTVFQSSEGEPAVPVVVPTKIDGDTIELTIPAGTANAGRFVGRISSEGITGSFVGEQLGPNGRKIIHLKRGKSYWQ
jgi:hypothetical protein